MKKEDIMIDALLQEHARAGAGDDEAFLESLEQRLNEEQKVGGEVSGSQRAGNRLGWGMGIAAALVVAAVGFYGWQQQYFGEKTAIATHEVENPASHGQGVGAAREGAAAFPQKKKELNRQMPGKDGGALMANPGGSDSRIDGLADVATDSPALAPAAVAAEEARAVPASSADAVLTQGATLSNSLADNVVDGDHHEKSRLGGDEKRVVVSTKEEDGKTRVTCILPRLKFDKTLFAPRTIIVKDASGNPLPASHQYQNPSVSFVVPDDQVAGIVLHVLYIDAEALQHKPTDPELAIDWQVRTKQFKLGDLLKRH